ncbi:MULTISPECIES: protein translocase subunit SecDF [Bacillus cereus group]|uniref:Multifunctional fusion protein n=3 Tax=Bacillus cereus group TaxID=86661 RepID=R8Q4T3_BACCE|nr:MULTISPECIES: protein translocase subunit SecDF [Bacillus cereus group]EJQ98300.1 protein-export membrane protein SecD [Bacillus cereus MC67]EOP21188.1 protein-export membrane protein SecD [Bacillus cereus MC118]EOP65393.1 protein-export membrane protein SecD [Bacillus cereus VD118]MBJ8092211.1 protein translocase subunit SecDF [Bacillus cereus]MCQ6357253.1 protein translocase subunit SecDF [Bacillus cereus]
MAKRGTRIAAFFLIVLLIGGVIGAAGKDIAKGISLGLDLRGGFEILYEVKPAKKGDKIDRDALVSTVGALENRVNVLGVSEPNIQIEGEDRIRVQLAGVQDQQKAREMLSTQAKLTFRDVDDNLLMDGADLKGGGAKQTFDEQGRASVGLTLKSADKFREVTEKISKMPPPTNLMVIWLDFEEGKDSYKAEAAKQNAKQNPKYLSAATVSQVFNQAEVSIVGGNFTVESAKELSSLLNAGALPVDLKEMYSTSVGAKFGQQALEQTIFASAIGIAIIFLFMLVFYRLPGIVAVVMLGLYIFVTLLVFNWMHAVLTLPGIAALVLGVGIAVDANIITYERLKEELKIGKSMMSAFRAGNHRSLSTILDANITTIAAAGVLFAYGNSSVKGFATSLIVSILVGFITNVFGTRFLLGLLVKSRYFDKKPSYFGVKEKDIIPLTKGVVHPPTKFDRINFVNIGHKFFLFSIAVVIAGAIILPIFKMNLGIDFASGTRIDLQSKQALTVSDVHKDFNELKIDVKEENIVPTGNDNKGFAVRTLGVLSKDEIAKTKTFFHDKYGTDPNVSTVSPTIGKEIARNAFIAVLIASAVIVLYVSIRFRLTYAVSAVIALLHDAFVMVVVFSLFQIEVDLTFIAAVLTIIGYSINDSIVTFDRNRELYKQKKRVRDIKDLEEIVNASIRQTIGRSINTVLTVLFPVIALLIFGSESLRNFSLALLIGLVVGTYSSIFVASQIWLMLENRRLKKGKNKKKVEKEVSEPQV